VKKRHPETLQTHHRRRHIMQTQNKQESLANAKVGARQTWAHHAETKQKTKQFK